jgi:hypothetical protein
MRIRVVPFMAVPGGALFGKVEGSPSKLGPLHLKLALDLSEAVDDRPNAVVFQVNDPDKTPGMSVHFELMDCVGYIQDGFVDIGIQDGNIKSANLVHHLSDWNPGSMG